MISFLDGIDIATDLGFHLGVNHLLPHVVDKILNFEWVAKNIGGAIADGVALGAVNICARGMTIVRNIYKIVNCIRDHISIHGQAKEQRDAAKRIYDKSKIARDQMKYFGKNMQEEIEKKNNQVEQLVTYTNKMLEELGAGCQTTNATLISDLNELKFFVEVLRSNLNMRVDIEMEKREIRERKFKQ